MTDILSEWDVPARTNFMRQGACAGLDTNIFFPYKGESHEQPMSICNGTKKKQPCPVRTQCLEYALELPMTLSGIWGGTSQKERRRLRAEREQAQRLADDLPAGEPVRYRAWSTS